MDIFEIKFKINDEEVTLQIPIDGSDHLFKMTNDDDYCNNYIIELINSGFISLNTPLLTIKRVDENDGVETLIYGINEDQEAAEADSQESGVLTVLTNSKQASGSEWSDHETRKLLDLYEQFLPNVGPLKKFKTKKNMWNHIAEIINKSFNSNKTGIQVENRYKTVLKRKKNAIDNNHKSGSSRVAIPFEFELNKIASIDDSIEPEVTGTASGIVINKRKPMEGQFSERSAPAVLNSASTSTPTSENYSPPSTPKLKKKVKTIQETLLDIHEKKELARERRHKEKLDLIKQLLSQTNSESNSSTCNDA